MRGLTLDGPKTIAFREDLPDPEEWDPRDAIVAVRLAGLCGSDLHPWHGREPIRWGTIPGHEFVGTVVHAGSAVESFREGDRVFGPFSTSCGACPACRRGLSSRCAEGALFGWCPEDGDPADPRWLQGTQAELLRVSLADSTLLAQPEELSDAEAVLLGDNFTTGWHCAEQAGFAEGDRVAVVGCGAVGLSAVAAARALGAGEVLAIDPVESRRLRAESLGARSAGPEEARSALGGEGAAAVLEAVGGPEAQRLAVSLCAPGATISSVGVQVGEPFAFSPVEAYDLNLSYRAGRCPARSVLERLLPRIAAGEVVVPADLLIDPAPVPLEQGAEAYRRFADRAGDGRKPLMAVAPA